MTMKLAIKKYVLSVIAVGAGCVCYGQGSTTAQAAATILTPISIAKVNDMNFGNIAVVPTAPGTVILDPSGSVSTGGGGGVTLPITTGTISAASFNVAGAASFTYAITLPTASIAINNGSNVMDLGTFTSSPSGTGLLSSAGAQVLAIGATLSVSAGQPTGIYTASTALVIAVNYN